jgi:hypothetical protein
MKTKIIVGFLRDFSAAFPALSAFQAVDLYAQEELSAHRESRIENSS